MHSGNMCAGDKVYAEIRRYADEEDEQQHCRGGQRGADIGQRRAESGQRTRRQRESGQLGERPGDGGVELWIKEIRGDTRRFAYKCRHADAEDRPLHRATNSGQLAMPSDGERCGSWDAHRYAEIRRDTQRYGEIRTVPSDGDAADAAEGDRSIQQPMRQHSAALAPAGAAMRRTICLDTIRHD